MKTSTFFYAISYRNIAFWEFFFETPVGIVIAVPLIPRKEHKLRLVEAKAAEFAEQVKAVEPACLTESADPRGWKFEDCETYSCVVPCQLRAGEGFIGRVLSGSQIVE